MSMSILQQSNQTIHHSFYRFFKIGTFIKYFTLR